MGRSQNEQMKQWFLALLLLKSDEMMMRFLSCDFSLPFDYDDDAVTQSTEIKLAIKKFYLKCYADRNSSRKVKTRVTNTRS